jgi:hypothetical protein
MAPTMKLALQGTKVVYCLYEEQAAEVHDPYLMGL